MSKLDKFLIMIIIINLFASIFIIFGEGNKKSKDVEIFEIVNFQEFVDVYKVGPSPERYRTFVAELVNERFNELINNTKGMSDSQLKEYYEKNNTTNDVSVISTMQSKYGISDYDTFYRLVKKSHKLNEKNSVYKKSSIVKNSCKLNQNYTTSEIVLKYSKSEEIHLVIEMSNIIKDDVQAFKISVKEVE